MLSAEKIQSNWNRYLNEIKTNISKERSDIVIPFLKKYENSKLGWVIGKFYSLLLVEKLEDNKPNPANEIINDIMRYAYSSTKDSSKFIKIYELSK